MPTLPTNTINNKLLAINEIITNNKEILIKRELDVQTLTNEQVQIINLTITNLIINYIPDFDILKLKELDLGIANVIEKELLYNIEVKTQYPLQIEELDIYLLDISSKINKLNNIIDKKNSTLTYLVDNNNKLKEQLLSNEKFKKILDLNILATKYKWAEHLNSITNILFNKRYKEWLQLREFIIENGFSTINDYIVKLTKDSNVYEQLNLQIEVLTKDINKLKEEREICIHTNETLTNTIKHRRFEYSRVDENKQHIYKKMIASFKHIVLALIPKYICDNIEHDILKLQPVLTSTLLDALARKECLTNIMSSLIIQTYKYTKLITNIESIIQQYDNYSEKEIEVDLTRLNNLNNILLLESQRINVLSIDLLQKLKVIKTYNSTIEPIKYGYQVYKKEVMDYTLYYNLYFKFDPSSFDSNSILLTNLTSKFIDLLKYHIKNKSEDSIKILNFLESNVNTQSNKFLPEIDELLNKLSFDIINTDASVLNNTPTNFY